ncbi:hypothetical protein E8E11_010437 [Didymella keratinophila]|nr:hypothetical protein E8E11_010437 [Didymella keratinophila]
MGGFCLLNFKSMPRVRHHTDSTLQYEIDFVDRNKHQLCWSSTARQRRHQAKSVAGNNFGIPGQNATYNYIIVGGGTAGLALAYRLAEDGTKTIAVVEAGGFYEVENGNTSVNQDYNYITPDSQWDAAFVDRGLLTTPQAGAEGQVFHYGRGKMLGGFSAENTMNYNRPTVGSLQSWADAVNDTSYT